MKKYLIIPFFCLMMAAHLMAFGNNVKDAKTSISKHANQKESQKHSKENVIDQTKKNLDTPFHKNHNLSSAPRLKSAYPWEYIQNNKKTFKFVVMNFYTDLFDPSKVRKIAKNIEDYVAKHVFPSWRKKITVEFFTPPSQEALAEKGLPGGAFLNAIPLPGTFIPIILTNDFSDNIPDHFATAVHGNVSGSPTTGYNASLYLDGDFYTLTGPFPFGTPFIVIPAGSAENGNGINGQIAANEQTGEGPTDFYQALSLVISQEVITLLIDPTAAQYVGSGNPLGSPSGGRMRKGTSGVTNEQIFYLEDATAPFLYGDDNIVDFNGWSVGNFALPAYFMPYDVSGRYDFLGRTSQPLTPYKGNQFVIYQNFHVTDYPAGKLTDLLVGNYISPLSNPEDIQLLKGGSIYDFDGWGKQVLSEVSNAHSPSTIKGNLNSASSTTVMKNIPTLTNSSVANCRNRNSKQLEQGITIASPSKKGAETPKSKQPQLLPFQFIDQDGFLTSRFAIINYIPHVISPEDVDAALPVLEKHIKDQYLPYYNIKAEVKNYTVLPGDVGLPEFDGTFIPFFILNLDQFDLKKLGVNPIGGGATNVNNVPNILTGPLITQYLKATADFSVPNLPLANPYLMVSQANFTGQVTVTTSPDVGTFTAIPTGSSLRIPTTFPIVAVGEDADPIYACSPLVNDLTGKIGVNLRLQSNDCDSLTYPNNMADAGAIAFLTVFDGGSTSFSAPGSKIWGATMGPEGHALIDALASNPDITITISAPEPSVRDLNTFTSIIAHEVEELLSDPNYATYILTFNPLVDKAVLFSQYEASDPDEGFDVITTKKDNSFPMNCFRLPSYFGAYLRESNYDNIGVIWRALVPESRQQVVFHYKHKGKKKFNPLHAGGVLGLTEGGFPDLFLDDFGSIFNPSTFYDDGGQSDGVSAPIPETPLNTIYDNLMNLRDVVLI